MSRNDLVNKNWLANSFRNFRKFCETVTCKYHKSCKNKQFKKNSRLKKRKGQTGPRKSRKIKGAKVTRIFLATSKHRVTNTSKIARMTILTKF